MMPAGLRVGASSGDCAYEAGQQVGAMFGSRPIATNSVAPMPKPPSARASSAKRIRAGDSVVGPS